MSRLRELGKRIGDAIDRSRLPIGRVLPGELDGTLDPRDYGFGVISVDPVSPEEEKSRVRNFYERAKARTGVTIPTVEVFLYGKK